MAVHLSIIFAMQSTVVVAAFAVVIWLLTNQQHIDLQKTIFRNIDQQQETTRDSLLEPFVKFETPVRRYGERIKAFPSVLQCASNSTVNSVSQFYEAVMLDVIRDSEIRRFSQFFEDASLSSSGNSSTTTIWGGCTLGYSESTRNLQVEAVGASSWQRADVTRPLPISLGLVDGMAPLDYSLQTSTIYPSSSSSAITHLKMQRVPGWTPGALFVNTHRNGATDFSVQYLLPIRHGHQNQTTHGIAVDFVMTNISAIIAAAKISPTSKVMLFEVRNGALLATTISTIPLLKNGNEQWPMLETPDPEMNTALRDALKRCPAKHCSSVTYLTDVNVISLRHIVTATNISMALLQLIPEEYFFEESRKTRLNGIFVGAAAAVLIVISCVMIWLAVYGPLNALQDNMELAANMQNDKVTSKEKRPYCILYEIAMLNECFDKMNSKLLLARAYMPQALLVGVGSGSGGDDDDDDDDDEGHLNIGEHYHNRSGTKEAHEDDDDEDEGEGDTMNLSLSLQRGTGETTLSSSRRSPKHPNLTLQHPKKNGDSGGGDNYIQSPTKKGMNPHSPTHTNLHRSGGKDTNNPQSPTYGHGGGKSDLPLATRKGNNNRNAADNMSESSLRSTAKRNARYTLTLSRAITNRRIGVLIVNCREFHRVVSEPNVNVTQLHQEFVELIEGSSKAEKGVVDAFQGDHFVLTFNAAMAVGAPAKGAALCALRIQNNVRARTAFPGVTMGLSAGLAMVGTLGSSEMKKFCMITPAFSQAISLEMSAKRVVGITSCLFSMRLAGDLDMHVYSQIVGQKYLCGANINANEGKVVNVAGVMGAITTQGDEWLYELEEGASKNPYSKINSAYELFLAKQYDRCAEVLSVGYPEKSDPGMIANWERLTEILNTDSSEWQL